MAETTASVNRGKEVRNQILKYLDSQYTASQLSKKLNLTLQDVMYHLRKLEKDKKIKSKGDYNHNYWIKNHLNFSVSFIPLIPKIS